MMSATGGWGMASMAPPTALVVPSGFLAGSLAPVPLQLRLRRDRFDSRDGILGRGGGGGYGWDYGGRNRDWQGRGSYGADAGGYPMAEAERRYEEYKASTQNYFEMHKDEDWLRDKYDPARLEGVVTRRIEFAKSSARDFQSELQAGTLDMGPAVHSTFKDLEAMSEDEKRKRNSRGTIDPPVASEPRRITTDIEQARGLIKKLDSEKGIEENILSSEPQGNGAVVIVSGGVRALEGVDLLDVMLTYLWRVHGLDYYGMLELRETPRGVRHVRAGGKSGEENGAVVPADWEKKLDSTWQTRLQGQDPVEVMLGREKLETATTDALDPLVRKMKDEKYGCGAKGCAELFDGPEFVHKHLKLKHADLINESVSRVREGLYSQNYTSDPNAPGAAPGQADNDNSQRRPSHGNSDRLGPPVVPREKSPGRDFTQGSSFDAAGPSTEQPIFDPYGAGIHGAHPFGSEMPPPVLMPVPGAGPLAAPADVTMQMPREQGQRYGGAERTQFLKQIGKDLTEWWLRMLKLSPDDYQGGKVLDQSVPLEHEILRGVEWGIEKLYVRKDFDDLYWSIRHSVHRSWLCHLNGNPGVGKSAFLWYFLIRLGTEMAGPGSKFVILYQSGEFIWEFTDSGASIWDRREYPLSSLKKSTIHLLNQKIPDGAPLGPRVLVAASPEAANTKAGKPKGTKSEVFLHSWDEDEFKELLKIWHIESSEKRREADSLFPKDGGSHLPDLRKFKTEPSVEARAYNLRVEADQLDEVVAAADLYYSWYGGIPRLLRQAHSTEQACEKIKNILVNKDLSKVYRAIESMATSDDVSWLLLHFKRPQVDGARYLLDFASSKIKHHFTQTLVRTKHEDLMILLLSSDPELAALRGYIFEQEVLRKVLNSDFAAAFLADNKHCSKCNSHTVEGVSDDGVVWMACKGCQKCLAKELQAANLYEVLVLSDLKAAVLGAGAEAVDFVWRPLNKSNAAFDFAILPRVLGQATISNKHPVPYQAVESGVAWNKQYRPNTIPQEYLLAFYLGRQNFQSFGYQSYHDKHRHVSNKAVKGIVQVKVLVETCELLRLPLPAEGAVDKLSDLDFKQHDLESMTVTELKSLAKSRGMKGFSSLRKDTLVAALSAWEEPEVIESLEYEREAYKLMHGDHVVY